MAKISLQHVQHSYLQQPRKPQDFALKDIHADWSDAGAYALLGPSGCGKTTLLNIISGLLVPTEGQVLFDGVDVTQTPASERNIAQVFQFPVVYDTMSVYDNLAFPLRNRGFDEAQIKSRVEEIADLLDLGATLRTRAAGLSADGKQKISLGRGLVREDVNVIMFDEPLTVIDPHLKWQLRSKLKELHQRIGVTMIYVTHDQTEALTFADKVVVMHDGEMVQVGTPIELFQNPRHTFVGHFIGSPGMNVLPCTLSEGQVLFPSTRVATTSPKRPSAGGGKLEIGIRPEYIGFADEGLAVEIVKIDDLGRHRVVETRHQGHTIKLIVPEDAPIPEHQPCIAFAPAHTQLYNDGWAVD